MMRRWTLDEPAAELVRLPEGAPIVIRPIRDDDGPLLVDGFARLSSESRRLRFLGGKSVLTSNDVRYLTDVDHRDHEALVAVDLDGRGVGVARFVRDRHRGRTAEVAIVVVDEWQRRGVGRQLLSRLAQRADDEGVRCFTGVMADDNVGVVALLRAAGSRLAITGIDGSTVEFIFPVVSLLADPIDADQLVASPCFA
jgi:GNAT superfamily N-acetyltransferase